MSAPYNGEALHTDDSNELSHVSRSDATAFGDSARTPIVLQHSSPKARPRSRQAASTNSQSSLQARQSLSHSRGSQLLKGGNCGLTALDTQIGAAIKNDTIATSPTLGKHVIPNSDHRSDALPALQQTHSGSLISEDGLSVAGSHTETLPPIRQLTGPLGNGQLTELAEVATQQMYSLQSSDHLDDQMAQVSPTTSPILTYHAPASHLQSSSTDYHTYSGLARPLMNTPHAISQPYSSAAAHAGQHPGRAQDSAIDHRRRTSASVAQRLAIPPSLPSASTGSSLQSHGRSTDGGYSTAHTSPPLDGCSSAEHPQPPLLPPPSFPAFFMTTGFRCDYPGCTAMPFHTQYLLSSHKNVHSQSRPHYCMVEGCPRSDGGTDGNGGKGFKRKNEMVRHGLVHNSPGFRCPFCPERERKYPRPDNLLRHVRVHHKDIDRDNDELRAVLAQKTEGTGNKQRRRRAGLNS